MVKLIRLYCFSLDEREGKEAGDAWAETMNLVRARQKSDTTSPFSLSFRRKFEEIETVL